MPRSEKQKIKLLVLYEILKNHSDESHPLTTKQLMEMLKAEGIECERKTLYEDIALLNQFPAFEVQYDIGKGKGKQNQYYVVNRAFDDAEIRILMDCVQSASFITNKKTDDLCNRISNLAGQHKAEILKGDVIHRYSRKHSNETVLYTVDTIDSAIVKNKKLSFLYFDLIIGCKRKYRKDGERYIVNPVGLIFTDGNYYFVCYSDKHKELTSYRIDRMDKTEIEQDGITRADCAKKFVFEKEQLAAFGMWSGETRDVTLLADNSLAGAIFDKFGERVNLIPYDDDRFKVKVRVKISPMFLGWCASFGDKLKVDAPGDVREQAVDYIKSTLTQYSEKC